MPRVRFTEKFVASRTSDGAIQKDYLDDHTRGLGLRRDFLRNGWRASG